MKTKLGMLAAVALVAAMLSGCGDEVTNVVGVEPVNSLAGLGCSQANQGEMVLLRQDGQAYVCNGTEWLKMTGATSGNAGSSETTAPGGSSETTEPEGSSNSQGGNGNPDVSSSGTAFYDPGDSGNEGTPTRCTNGTFTDTRDGKTYKCVTIGTQTWMAENLNFGVMIPIGATQIRTTASYAQKHCKNDSAVYCDKSGGQYQWHTAMALSGEYVVSEVIVGNPHRGICPAGWHVPSNGEWKTLKTWVDNDNGGQSNDEAVSLKNATEWGHDFCDAYSHDTTVCVRKHFVRQENTDAYGFNAIPAGATWWSTEFKFVKADANSVAKINSGGTFGLDMGDASKQSTDIVAVDRAVRCIQD